MDTWARERTPAFARAAALLLAASFALPAHAAPPDALQFDQLEQDLRLLRRTVERLERRVEALERNVAPRVTGSSAAADASAASAGDVRAPSGTTEPALSEAPWLRTENWDRLREGLPELEVIALLGPPASMRTSDDGERRTLFYVLEIGASGFLAGNVVLEDRRVVAFEPPRLR